MEPVENVHNGKNKRLHGSEKLQANQKSVVHLLDLPVSSIKKFVLWLSPEQQQPTSNVTLTKELDYFSAYVELDDQETSARSSTFADIRDAIHGTFPQFGVGQFGSYPAGLSIYRSDIDVTVVRPTLRAESRNKGIPDCEGQSTGKRPCSPLNESASKRSKRNSPQPSSSLASSAGQVTPDSPVHEDFNYADDHSEPSVTWAIDTTAAPGTMLSATKQTELCENEQSGDEDGCVDNVEGGSQEEGEVSDGDGSFVCDSEYSDGDSAALQDGTRADKLDSLQDICDILEDCEWVQRLEFRKFARVPIINLTHKNGVECDISLDMSQQATSLVVRALLQRCGPALVKLSAFLKIYLNQLSLDAPFTGGLGSYKLYVLLAKHIERNPQMVTNPASPELGPLLLSFLKYYGSSEHLNEHAEVEVEEAETVDFVRTTMIQGIQQAFEKAHQVLFKQQMQRSLRKMGSAKSTDNDQEVQSEASSSLLARLLNTEHLSLHRRQSRAQCHKYPHRSEDERAAVAEGLLQQLNSQVGDITGVPGNATIESVAAANPALAARLRSFPSVQEGLATLCGETLTTEQEMTATAVLNMYADYLRDHSQTEAAMEDTPAAATPELLEQASVPVIPGQQEIARVSPYVPPPVPPPRPPPQMHSFLAVPPVPVPPVLPLVPPFVPPTFLQSNVAHFSHGVDPVIENAAAISPTSTLQELCAAIPLLALQCAIKSRYKLDPAAPWAKEIVSGAVPMPKWLFVDEASRLLLPVVVQRQLGPFRSLAIAERFVGKSFEQLLAQEKRCRAAVNEVRRRLKANLLFVPSTTELRDNFEMNICLSLLKRLIIAGYIPVPPRREPATKLHLENELACVYREETQYAEYAANKYIWYLGEQTPDFLTYKNFLTSAPKRLKTSQKKAKASATVSSAEGKKDSAASASQPAPGAASANKAVSSSSAGAAAASVQAAILAQCALATQAVNWPAVSYEFLEECIPFLAAQHPASKNERLFEPGKALAQKILASQGSLPLGTIVSDEHRHLLPPSIVAKLGPFRSLALAQKYVGKSYEQLVEQQQRCNQAILEIQRRHNSGLLTFSADKLGRKSADQRALRSFVIAGIIAPPKNVDLHVTNVVAVAQNTESALARAAVEKYIADMATNSGHSGAPGTSMHSTVLPLTLSASSSQPAMPTDQMRANNTLVNLGVGAVPASDSGAASRPHSAIESGPAPAPAPSPPLVTLDVPAEQAATKKKRPRHKAKGNSGVQPPRSELQESAATSAVGPADAATVAEGEAPSISTGAAEVPAGDIPVKLSRKAQKLMRVAHARELGIVRAATEVAAVGATEAAEELQCCEPSSA